NNGNLPRVARSRARSRCEGGGASRGKSPCRASTGCPRSRAAKARAREDGCERVVRHDAAPTKQLAKNDSKAIEPPRKGELQSHTDAGAQPDADAETCRLCAIHGHAAVDPAPSLNLSPGNQCPQRRRPSG